MRGREPCRHGDDHERHGHGRRDPRCGVVDVCQHRDGYRGHDDLRRRGGRRHHRGGPADEARCVTGTLAGNSGQVTLTNASNELAFLGPYTSSSAVLAQGLDRWAHVRRRCADRRRNHDQRARCPLRYSPTTCIRTSAKVSLTAVGIARIRRPAQARSPPGRPRSMPARATSIC